MFNLQGSEIIVILLLALVVLGPEKLPDAVRRFTQTYNELKKMGAGFQSELKSALDEPMREMRETADMVRDAANPDTFTASADTKKAPAAPAPGDPPLVEPVDDEPRSESEPPRPVNQIAAANSSGAMAEARAGASTPDASDVDDAPPADQPPPGPAFHSAAPPRIVQSAHGESAAVEPSAGEIEPAEIEPSGDEPSGDEPSGDDRSRVEPSGGATDDRHDVQEAVASSDENATA